MFFDSRSLHFYLYVQINKMYRSLARQIRSVSSVIAAVLHAVVRAAEAVPVTSPASTRAVRLLGGRPGAGVTGGRLPSQRVLVHLCYRVGNAVVGGLRGVNRISAPDVVAEPADSIPGSKDTDVAHTDF